ncbi:MULTISPECIES: PTS lactose/cellobiose transporter subunit IIA [Ligilactobacillus]|jgi:PTS system lactose-specific IIA component|uniref:PTS lactose/cellobiose transporter subunit IIA n=1 Tax=Ligilactobacillus TaxID=2767887 RepID=UPI0023BC6324|nr:MULTISPECIES: PTS lactose/cellobiose transporter subunit IIA [Ligilactobacillus]MDE7022824.1 PTS lactose/cellobiose transporter subunit IIA [Ligilactobacillus sp.]WOY89062.1 PTS lactose/cellobiose transporter subunit IIA [Ligilactobacillus murinus]
MTTKKEISQIGLKLVAYAGDARSDLIEALESARKGDFDSAKRLLSSAKESLVLAHNTQTELLAREAGGSELEVTFIMVHGQDTLMTTMMLYDQARFMLDEYQRLARLEAKLDLGGVDG